MTRLVKALEKPRFGVAAAYLWIAGLAFARTLLENLFFYKGIHLNTFALDISLGEIHFYVVVFLGWVAVTAWLSKQDAARPAGFILTFWWATLIAPLVNRFAIHDYQPLGVLQPEKFLDALLVFPLRHETEMVVRGIVVEYLFLTGSAGLYVYLKTKSAVRTLLAPVGIHLLIWILTMLHTVVLRYTAGFSFGMAYFFISLFAAWAFARHFKRDFLSRVIERIRPTLGLHLLGMAFLGVVLSKGFDLRIEPYGILRGDLRLLSNLLKVLLPVLFAGQCLAALRGLSLPSHANHVAEGWNLSWPALLGVLALFLGTLNGSVPFLLIVLFLATAALYSLPPLQLNRFLFGSVFMGLWSVLAFLFGYFAGTPVKTVLASDAAVMAALVFLGCSIGSTASQVEHYETHRIRGVDSFLTVFGRETGKMVVSALTFLCALLPLAVIREAPDLLLLITLGLAAAASVHWLKTGRVALVCYLVGFTYFVVRHQGFVRFGGTAS